MTAQEILCQVRERGAVLVVIDGKLKAAPPGVLPPALKAAIRNRATEIKAMLLPPKGARAYSILTDCQRYGVALRIDAAGDLVVGKAGAKAEEPTQPWQALLRALTAHVEDVAILVEAGWTLTAAFPREAAA